MLSADQEDFQLKLQDLRGRQWLFGVLASEIPLPGDWLRVDLLRDSPLVVRRKGGSVGALRHTCRHRRFRICLQERGHASGLMWLIPPWSHDLTGQLVGARNLQTRQRREAVTLANPYGEPS